MGRPKLTALAVYNDTEKAYAPNTIGAVGKVAIAGLPKDDPSFLEVIERLVNLQELGQTSGRQVAQQVRLRFVVCDFLCRKFNIVPPWPLVDDLGRALNAKARKYIRMLGAEATALFNLVSDVWAVAPIPGYSSAAVLWGEMMLAGASGIATDDSTPAPAKREAIALYSAITGQLRARVNPFTHGAHRDFFDYAVCFAQQATGRSEDRYSIYARSYLPYLRARADLIEYISSKKSQTKMLKK